MNLTIPIVLLRVTADRKLKTEEEISTNLIRRIGRFRVGTPLSNGGIQEVILMLMPVVMTNKDLSQGSQPLQSAWLGIETGTMLPAWTILEPIIKPFP